MANLHEKRGAQKTSRLRTDASGQSGVPAFSVQDEIHRDRRLRCAGRYRRVKRRVLPFAAVTVCVLLCFALLVTAAVFLFRVDTVMVWGNARYTDGEILTASGVQTGDSMLLIDREKLFRRIVAACPYIESLEIEKVYPSSLTISVVETGAVYYTRVRDRLCTLDASLRVIECSDDVDGLIELRLSEVKTAVEGSRLAFTDTADEMRVRTVLNTLGGADDVLSFDCIDLRDRYNITAYITGQTEVYFGDAEELDIKFALARRVYATALAENEHSMHIDVSEPSRVSVGYN